MDVNSIDFHEECIKLSDITYEETEEFAQPIFEARAKDILPFAANEFGIEENDLRRRFRGVRMIPTLDVNALTRISFSEPEGSFMIEISYGLFLYYIGMGIIFSSRFGFREDSKIEFSKVSPETTFEQAKDWIGAFWKRPEGQIIMLKQQIIFNLSKEQERFVDKLIYDANLFTVAHEFCHAMIKMANPNEKISALLDSARYLTRRIPEIESDCIEDSATELVCDLIGLALSLKCRENIVEKWFMYSRAEWNLVILELLEAFYWKQINPPHKNVTHPPAVWRRRWLRRWAERETERDPQSFQDYFSLACSFQGIARMILQRL
jgi:hypothetical protein